MEADETKYHSLSIFHTLLGAVFDQLDRAEDAIVEYAKAIELDSGCVEAYLNWGASLENSGKMVEARQKYMAALEIEPDNPVIKALLASVQSHLSDEESHQTSG